MLVVLNNYLNWSWRKTAATDSVFEDFFGVDIPFIFSVNFFMRLKLGKKLRESSFACWINKSLIILRFKTYSIKFNSFKYFNNFTLLEIKFTPLNHKPFEVCKCVRLCTLLSSAVSWKYWNFEIAPRVNTP